MEAEFYKLHLGVVQHYARFYYPLVHQKKNKNLSDGHNQSYFFERGNYQH